LSFTFLTTDGALEEIAAAQIQSNLEACGAELRIEVVPPERLNFPWPDGPVFGRGFETVASVWPDWISPVCEAFASWEIPNDDNPFGSNAGGFANNAYDEACRSLLYGPPDTGEYLEAIEEIQRIFREELPSLPLYLRPRLLIHRLDACGVQVDATAFSTLWALEQVDQGESCP
jgi:ABC-type transport system substrate-binding protein